MKYPVIIFDWDGTLVDSLDKIVASVQQAAIVTGLDVPTAQAIRHIIGLSLDKAMQTLYPMQSLQKQNEMVAAYKAQYRQSSHHATPFYPGIKEWLISLKEQGYLLAVATGKGRNGLQRIMEEHDVSDLFAVTYCADETISKPDPLMINKILSDLNLQADQALMIGDSSYDLEMANNANVDCIGVSYGVHCDKILSLYNPVAIVDDLPKQLANYL